MEQHVTVLWKLWVAYSALVAFVSLAGMSYFLAFTTDDKTAGELLFVAVLHVQGIVGAIGLAKKRRWARTSLMVLGVVNLVSFPPFGTALGVYSIWVLSRGEARQLLISGSRT